MKYTILALVINLFSVIPAHAYNPQACNPAWEKYKELYYKLIPAENYSRTIYTQSSLYVACEPVVSNPQNYKDLGCERLSEIMLSQMRSACDHYIKVYKQANDTVNEILREKRVQENSQPTQPSTEVAPSMTK